ncbi:hypothetical protein [Kordia sp.]|uniref:hypothetical protein n=1 Tax=Kordia sp. TaxID=1965332 RepID=UPI003D2D6686
MQKQLTQKDRKKLQKKIGFVAVFAIFAIAILSFIYFFILKGFTSNSDGFGYIPLIIFGLFGLFFAGIIGYMAWAIIQDINTGVKNCIDGIVEDKKLNIRHSTSGGSGVGRSSGRRTSTKRDYSITIDGTEHKVEYDMYSYVSVGDHIYFEVAPKSAVVLHYEVVEEVVAEPKHIVSHTKTKYPDSKIRKAPLIREDKNTLQKFYSQKIRSRLLTIAIIAFPIFGLILNGLGSLLIFIFPLPIVFIYQLYKLYSFHTKYRKSVNEGRKQLITTQVIDKLFTTVSNNGRKHNKRNLKTTYGSVQVSEDVYQKINSGDEITIHKALHLPYSLGISMDEIYYAAY